MDGDSADVGSHTPLAISGCVPSNYDVNKPMPVGFGNNGRTATSCGRCDRGGGVPPAAGVGRGY